MPDAMSAAITAAAVPDALMTLPKDPASDFCGLPAEVTYRADVLIKRMKPAGTTGLCCALPGGVRVVMHLSTPPAPTVSSDARSGIGQQTERAGAIRR